jgi:hypothetical protein
VLVLDLIKGLADTVNANGVFIVIIGDVAILAILVVVIFIALSKGLVVAIMLP